MRPVGEAPRLMLPRRPLRAGYAVTSVDHVKGPKVRDIASLPALHFIVQDNRDSNRPMDEFVRSADLVMTSSPTPTRPRYPHAARGLPPELPRKPAHRRILHAAR